MTLAELEQAKAECLKEIAAAADAVAVEALRVKYVGRNGSIPALIKAMKDVPKEERPAFGKAVQAWKAEAEAAKAALLDELNRRGVDRLDAGTYKVTVTTVTSSRIDTKALKAAAPELAERFSKEIVTQRFNVR